MQCHEIMTCNVLHVGPEITVEHAARKMFEEMLGFLPVCNEQGQPIGVLTDRDITLRACAEGLAADQTRVEEIMDFLDLQAYRERMVAELPFGIQKSVELARALALEPELLLLDEPSSGLNPEETQDLCFWIEDIKEDLGITVLLVEHDMRVVTEVTDSVTALDFGSVIADGKPEEVQRHSEVIRAFLGEED